MGQQFLADLKTAVSQAVHQCNNHLSIILSNCELTLALNDPELSKKKMESCISRVAQLTDLLAQLNRFATVNGEIKPVNIRQLFETAFKQIEARANAQQILCTTHVLADGLTPLPVQIFTLLTELLGTNALLSAAAGSEKKVSFEVLQLNGEITIHAANSGKDPDSTIEKTVFGTYFSNKSEPVYDSLASVKSLTDLLGGKIEYKKNNGMNELILRLPLKYETGF
ncbi:MAG: hypothetical protein K0R29_1155 [Pseudobdellovibrio sp.]|jgi:phosphoglycerate-specific signal transduction histidine kinase|nr:hypothetical protein [Pseudobdellovibrio sp.]